MAGKEKKKKKNKKKKSPGGVTGRVYVGVAGEGNSICAVKIRKTKTGAELLEAKQFGLVNSLDSVEIAGEIFEDFESIENPDDVSVDISENDEELSLLGISTDDDEKKDDSGVFIEILKMASDRGTKMAISLAEPQVFYNVFDSDFGLKGKKLNKRVVAELATMKEEYVSLKDDSYQLVNVTDDRLMAIVREPELAVIHQMDAVKNYSGNHLPFISFIESSEVSLINLVLQSYDLPEEANSLILHVGPETSHFIFLQGTKLHHISPSIATGYNSENVGGTLSSRLLFELDSLDLQKVDNVFLSGYAAKTEVQSFLEDTFQGDTAIQVLTVDKLDKGTFEDDLPPEKDDIDPFAPVAPASAPISDMMPDYELEDPFSSDIPGSDNSKSESETSSEPKMSLEDELAMELGGEISAGSSVVDQDQELIEQEEIIPVVQDEPDGPDFDSVPYTDIPNLPDEPNTFDSEEEIETKEETEIEVEPEIEEPRPRKDVVDDDLISRVEEELRNIPFTDLPQEPDQLEEIDETFESDEPEVDISDTTNSAENDDNESDSEGVIDYKPDSDKPFIIREDAETVESTEDESSDDVEAIVSEEAEDSDAPQEEIDSEKTSETEESEVEAEHSVSETEPEEQSPEADEDSTKDDNSPPVILDVPDEFSRADIELAIYAPALGAAMRAAGMTGFDFIDLDICPTKIKEGQNRLMISTPGWVIMMLIPLIGAYTYLEVEKQAKVISDLKWELIPLREQIGEFESIQTSITAAENTLANFERSFSVIDSLVIGTDTWSTFLNKVMNISDDLAGFWFTEISSIEGNKARLSGYSVYRNRIPRFIERLGNAQLKRVDVQEIRKKKVYRFEVEAIITKDDE